ncbi:MAG: hypothetical protein LQ352_000857 [Teloschistes flavicans]|nr:MAG: hypothetical protein LQ352_000857 [Teloschistes flavicans]
MRLDTTQLRYLTPEDWRVLTAQLPQVEIGSKNHEVIPTSLILQISNLRSGSGAHKSISTLAKANLIARVKNAKYDGYRLTYGGLDYLALHTHFQRHTLQSTGPCIGTGKESDIHLVLGSPEPLPSAKPTEQAGLKAQKPTHRPPRQTAAKQSKPPAEQLILKIHRLGRISFRTVKTNRDYLRHRQSANWMYMSRLSAMKEHTFMTALHNIGFPVPTPLAWNRHTVVMSLIEGTPLYQIKHLQPHEAKNLYADLLDLIVRLADVGLIHGDFNEFNIMIVERESGDPQPKKPEISGEERPPEATKDATTATTTTITTLHPILIDFPQMLSVAHPNASAYFDRDVDCIKRYFSRRFHFVSDDPGPFFVDAERRMRQNKGCRRLDVEVEASGFSKKMAKELEKYVEENAVDGAGSDHSTGTVSGGSDEELDEDTPRERELDMSPSDHGPAAHVYETKETSQIRHDQINFQHARFEDRIHH